MKFTKKEIEAIGNATIYDVDTKTVHTQEELRGDWINANCPRCGAKLLANKVGDKWCSNAGGSGMSPCTYGLKEVTPTP